MAARDDDDLDIERIQVTPGKGAARRRVDAYHEALRERNALRDLEQPFLLDPRERRL